MLYICCAAKLCKLPIWAGENQRDNGHRCQCRWPHYPEHVMEVLQWSSLCIDQGLCDFKYYHSKTGNYSTHSGKCIEYKGKESWDSLPKTIKELDDWWFKHDNDA